MERTQNTKGTTLNKKKFGRFGAGLSAYTDEAGDAAMGQTRANLSLASFIPASKKSYVGVGLQASLVQKKLDNTQLLFPNQYNGLTYDVNQSSNENFSGQNFIYPDIAAGAIWSYAQDETRTATHDLFKANIGFSAYHLNRPAQKFLQAGNTDLFMKFVFHGDLFICKANSNVAFAPSWLLQLQGSSKEIILGSLIKYFINDNSKYTGIVKRSSVNYGAYYRNRDAIIICLMYEKEQEFTVGLSYDLNVSKLVSASSARGGMELIMRYTPSKNYFYKEKAMF
jgi:type IX secretion system PorP/SprF family membrane protein